MIFIKKVRWRWRGNPDFTYGHWGIFKEIHGNTHLLDAFATYKEAKRYFYAYNSSTRSRNDEIDWLLGW